MRILHLFPIRSATATRPDTGEMCCALIENMNSRREQLKVEPPSADISSLIGTVSRGLVYDGETSAWYIEIRSDWRLVERAQDLMKNILSLESD